MTIAVLLILGVLWAAVLVPPVLRSRSETRRGEAIGPMKLGFGSRRDTTPSLSSSLGAAFNRPPAGGAYRPSAFPSRPNGTSRMGAPTRIPGQMTPAQKRRRDILVTLAGSAGLSLLVALFTGATTVWILHGVVDLLLVAYVFLLVQMKQRSRVFAARTNLPPPIPIERPRQARHLPHREFALRRTAGD